MQMISTIAVQMALAFAARSGTCRPGSPAPRMVGGRLRLCLRVISLVLSPVLSASAFGQGDDPVRFVFAFNRDISTQMGAAANDAGEQRRRFAGLIDEGLDLDVIGERLLGWRWAMATPPDRQAFRREFRGYLVQNFATKVKGLSEDQMIVTSVVPDAGTVLVRTQLGTTVAGRETYAWRVALTAMGWRLCDVVVNGISMAEVVRSQFDAILQNSQGRIGPLLHVLHDKST